MFSGPQVQCLKDLEGRDKGCWQLWGQGHAEAGPGHGYAGEPGSAGPMAGPGTTVESWRTALLPCHWGKD